VPFQSWSQTLVTAQAAGASVTTNAADTSCLPTQAVFTLPANFLNIGQKLRITAYASVTTTAAGTLTVKTKFSGIFVFISPSTTVVTALGPLNWRMDLTLTCRAVGSGTNANLMGAGTIISGIYGAAGAVTVVPMPTAAPVVGNGFDSTISNPIDFTVNWSLTGQTFILQDYAVESLN
jgi:hypothetical protein